MAPALAVTDAAKRFGEVQALDGASVELRRGEWLALLGPNGAGKTTLIRAIAGRLRLDGGSIRLLGEEIAAGGPAARRARARLGVVPQDVALYPQLTAAENLAVFGRLAGVTAGELGERIERALEFTALTERADRRVETFSGGMKRRLNIACGVLHEPEVILLDEPTVGVDPQSRQRIAEMLSRLRDGGASLLLTTHQLDEVQQQCDRIAIVDHGRAIADGTLDELVTRTIGRGRRLAVRVDRDPRGLAPDDGVTIDGRTIRRRVDDVAATLPSMLVALREAGLTVEDVSIDSPTLHDVFIHLTGRELRE